MIDYMRKALKVINGVIPDSTYFGSCPLSRSNENYETSPKKVPSDVTV